MERFHNININSTNFIKSACQAVQVKLYIKLKEKFGTAERNIWFNKQCLDKSLVPKYVSLKTKSNSKSAATAVRKAEISWITSELKFWFKVRDSIGFYLFELHIQLINKLHALEWDSLDSKVRDICSKNLHRKTVQQQKKLVNLERLKVNSSGRSSTSNLSSKFTFSNKVKNLSNVDFNDDEVSLLGKGNKIALDKYQKKDFKLLAAHLDKNADIHRNKLLTNRLASILVSKKPRERLENKYKDKLNSILTKSLKSINSKVKNNDLVITKADKGGTTVILERNEYIVKVEDFIKKNNFESTKIDPTVKFNALLRKKIKDSKGLFNDWEKKFLTQMNPQTPRLFGLPKLHKDGTPIRPVVSSINAPAHKLSYKINSLFRNFTSFKPKYSVKNSIDLIEKLSKVKVPDNARLVSFDVTNLFTSVPVQESLLLAGKILDDTQFQEPSVREELKTLLKACTDQNFFKFNGSTYIQKDGLAMGSPLSPLLAEIFMDNFERQLIENSNFKKNIKYWFRYVDDILCLWEGSLRQLETFHSNLNKTHKNIHFTKEIEVNNQLNYLDLSIAIQENKHHFKIFRKPTSTDSVIPMNSCHPFQHKLATFHSLLDRLLRVPMSTANFKMELGIILQIAVNNGYKKQIIYNLLNKKKQMAAIKSVYSQQSAIPMEGWITLPYIGVVSHRLGNVIKKEGLQIAFKTSPLLNTLMNSSKDCISNWEKSGVYKLKCGDCDANYVGQTGRSFQTRIAEHTSARRMGNRSSKFAEHLLDTGHSFNPTNNVEFIHFCQKSKLLDVLEAIEIHKLKKDNSVTSLNDQTEFVNYNISKIVENHL
jgi:hypothetical protein